MRFALPVIVSALLLVRFTGSGQSAEFKVAITVDAASPRGALRPAWRFFGYDEAKGISPRSHALRLSFPENCMHAF
jgi:hypothetical protein